MVSTPPLASTRRPRDHGFHPLRVGEVERETADAVSFGLDVPAHLADTFAYRAGQFCNVRVEIGGRAHVRCYSMSSAPETDPVLRLTVKRVPDGLVSNWIHDHLDAGHLLEVGAPTGFFQLRPEDGDCDLVAYAAGSGITPVFSLLKSALATTRRRVRLLYANRDAAGTIFRAALDDLVSRHGGRLEVVHHLDIERGFVDAVAARGFAGDPGSAYYLCGPSPFMHVVEEGLRAAGVEPGRVHVERFTPAGPAGGPPVDPGRPSLPPTERRRPA